MEPELRKYLNDYKYCAEFLSRNLDIDEKFDIIKDIFLFSGYERPVAYTIRNGKIFINDRMKELLYYVIKDGNLEGLKDGARFILYHELGHFHGINYKNRRINSYLENILSITSEKSNLFNSFPESEATRYALAKSKNYVNSLAGYTAMEAFVFMCSVNESLKTLETHFSPESEKNDAETEYALKKLKSISGFYLSPYNRKQIIEKAEKYADLLESRYTMGLFLHVKSKLHE